MFEQILAGDVLHGYVAAAIVVFALMVGTLLYQGRGIGGFHHYLGILVISVFIAAIWPAATMIVLIGLPWYIYDQGKRYD